MTATGRLLIVEDELLIAEHLRSSLVEMGYEVVGIAANMKDAMVLAETGPDLALLDIRIQGAQDGIETAALLQQDRDVAVLFITAYTDRETLERAKQLEPLAYLVKPFTDRTLGASVECALHRQRQERRRRRNLSALSAAVAGLRDGVLFTDEGGVVQSTNAAAVRHLGCDSEKTILGRNLIEVAPLSPQGRAQLVRWLNEPSTVPLSTALLVPGNVIEFVRIPDGAHCPTILATVRAGAPWPIETRDQIWSGRRTSSGEPLVTVCAMCRRAQENADNYVSLDSFLALRFSLAFSHSICPKCLAGLETSDDD